MKTPAIILSLLLLTGVAQAMPYQVSQTVNQLIPDGSPSGIAQTINISGQNTFVGDVTVNLNISGTWNGDLYAYLVHDGVMAVLLNRVGSTPGNIYGYGDSGLNITLNDSAANGNIHAYQNVTTPTLGAQLTGVWAPDGRAVSPFSVTGQETPTALLSSFAGQSLNGNWTLFLADVSGGDLNTLNSWGLSMEQTNVPDPACPGAFAGAIMLLAGMAWRKRC